MLDRSQKSGFYVVVGLSIVGLALLAVPPWIASQIDAISKLGSTWLYAYLTLVVLGGLLLAGSTIWIGWKIWKQTVARRKQLDLKLKNPSQLNINQREAEFQANLEEVLDLSKELAEEDELRRELQPLLDELESKRVCQKLEIVAFGAISSGKSSLLNALSGRDMFRTDPRGGTTVERNEIAWPGLEGVYLVDTPGLAEIDGAERGCISTEAAKDADIVLLVVDGPLRDWEFQLLSQLAAMEKRVVVCLNKSDWYGSREQQHLMGQIREQVSKIVAAEDVVAVRSETTKRNRVRVLSDGSTEDEEVTVPPEIGPLAERMMHIVRRDGRLLLLANLLLRSRSLVSDAKSRVQLALDRRAHLIVDRYMWGAGGAAALSPWPLFDIIAGAAISTKMVVDLGQVYRQQVDLNTAVRLLGQLGKNVLGILGVHAATPAIGAIGASLLKAVPGAGTIAGGILQGIVQAIMTRWIGAVFIAYFKDGMKATEGGLVELARREWERLTTVDELRRMVQMAKAKLSR